MTITITRTATRELWWPLPRHQAISAMVVWMWSKGIDETITEVIEK